MVESYVHAFMMLVSDCISILATTGFLYPYWRWGILCIHIGDDYDTHVSKVTTLGPVPHAFRVCLGALHDLTGVIIAYVLGEYLHS